MKSSPRALAAVLAAFACSAWAQVGDGPVQALTAPPTIYSSAPPSTAVRSPTPALMAVKPAAPPGPFAAKPAPRPGMFAAASALTATRMTADAREERRFLRDAAAQSRFELDASRLAIAKSSDSGLRSLAASLINHNNTVGLELAHLLHSRGMAPPMLANDQRKALNQLNKLNGSRFDAAYLQQVGLRQALVARDYEKAGLTIREPQINAWVMKTLPVTRYHLMLAERAQPADPRLAKWNRAAGVKPALVKSPAPMPQVGPRPFATSPLLQPAGPVGVQPVAATVSGRPSASNTQ
jgi:putative membrane protein